MANADLSKSEEILRQLGGTRFLLMTGASFVTGRNDPPRLSFKLGKGARKKITHVQITLNPRDTYTVEFRRIRGISTNRLVSGHSDIDAEQLCALMTEETGFALSF